MINWPYFSVCYPFFYLCPLSRLFHFVLSMQVDLCRTPHFNRKIESFFYFFFWSVWWLIDPLHFWFMKSRNLPIIESTVLSIEIIHAFASINVCLVVFMKYFGLNICDWVISMVYLLKLLFWVRRCVICWFDSWGCLGFSLLTTLPFCLWATRWNYLRSNSLLFLVSSRLSKWTNC